MTFWQQVKSRRLLAAMLVLTAGLYVQVWQHTLVWDEHALTAQQVVLHPSLTHYARSVQETYRPLALVSVAVDHLVWRGWPPGYAVDSLAYHLLVVVLLFMLARRWLTPFPAVTAALIAALHPVGAETVSYLLGRPDLLSAACMLAALLAFRRLDLNERRVSFALFWLFGLLAFLAKETALLLPFLALVLDGAKATDHPSTRLLSRLTALAPVVALIGLYVVGRLGGWITVGPSLNIHLGIDQLAVMASTAATALGALVWPVDLCPWYEGRMSIPASPWPVIGLFWGLFLGGLATTAYVVWKLRHRSPAVSLGLAWLTGIVALIALRAVVDPAPMNPLAVRWLYPAMLGLALMVGGVIQSVEAGWPLASRLAILCLLALYAGVNWQAQSLWQNDLSVFGRVFRCSPHSPLITLQYAKLLERTGHAAEGMRLRTQLINEQPDHPIVLSQLLGDAVSHGNYEEALIVAKRLVARQPSFSVIRKLAELEHLTGRQNDAIRHYQRALTLRPGDPLALTTLGSIYEHRRQWQKAADLYRHNLTRDPTAANIWFRYGRVLKAQGRFGEAETSFQRVIELDPFCPDGPLAVASLQEHRGAASAAETTRQRYTDLTHQPLQPRPVTDTTDSPCGMEIKVLYPRTNGQNPSAPP
jgi:protein O-mannosyl-transferase